MQLNQDDLFGNDFVMCENCLNQLKVTDHIQNDIPVNRADYKMRVCSIKNLTNEDFYRLENDSYEILSLDPHHSENLRAFSFANLNFSKIGKTFTNFNFFIVCPKCRNNFKNSDEFKQHYC